MQRNYEDDAALVDYSRHQRSLGLLLQVLLPSSDLLAGYCLQPGREAGPYGRATDHWLSVGATGGILPKLTGTPARRLPTAQHGVGHARSLRSFQLFMAGLTWPVMRKLTVSLNALRGASAPSRPASPSTPSSFSRSSAPTPITGRLQFNTGLSTGVNDFLGVTQGGRRDTFFSWDTGFQYKMNEHFQFSGTYVYFRNWSSLPIGDYENHRGPVSPSASRYLDIPAMKPLLRFLPLLALLGSLRPLLGPRRRRQLPGQQEETTITR